MTTMLFLPYSPRGDADARGYDDWLRQVDNPFFNTRPGIRHYSNWKVIDGAAAHGFTHFDFLLLDEGFASARVWEDAPLAAFAADWVRAWGADPDGEAAANYHCYEARLEGGDAGTWAERVAIDPEGGAGERWSLVAGVVGTPPWPSFTRRFGASDGALVGELIAAP